MPKTFLMSGQEELKGRLGIEYSPGIPGKAQEIDKSRHLAYPWVVEEKPVHLGLFSRQEDKGMIDLCLPLAVSPGK